MTDKEIDTIQEKFLANNVEAYDTQEAFTAAKNVHSSALDAFFDAIQMHGNRRLEEQVTAAEELFSIVHVEAGNAHKAFIVAIAAEKALRATMIDIFKLRVNGKPKKQFNATEEAFLISCAASRDAQDALGIAYGKQKDARESLRRTKRLKDGTKKPTIAGR